jgi:hypothetical protein
MYACRVLGVGRSGGTLEWPRPLLMSPLASLVALVSRWASSWQYGPSVVRGVG